MAPKKSAPVVAKVQKSADQLLAEQIAAEQELPHREAQLYKQLIKYYEAKQMKKAQKNAELVLAKFPHNGETLCLKGIVESSLPNANKETCLQLIKDGVRYNMKSSVSWHILGLFQRQERNYAEAIKAYNFASRLDKDNMTILRDLSNLQVQMRLEEGNLSGFIESRVKLLQNRSGLRANWVTLVAAHYLVGNYSKCWEIISSFEESIGSNTDAETGKYEKSEFALFKNNVLELAKGKRDAFDDTFLIGDIVTDNIGLLERRASLAQDLGIKDIAEKSLRDLIDMNPDHHEYYHSLVKVLNIGSDISALDALYAEMAVKYPYASATQRLPLDYSTGDLFESKVDSYLRKRLRKGIPSLFRDIWPLYNTPEKAATIEKLLKQYLSNLDKLKFSATESDNSESPACVLWTLAFAAQHYDYYSHDTCKALENIDRAIAHTPTMIDLYCIKARIFKHSLDFATAHKWFEQARSMDLADRYLNVKSVEYACRADATDEAEKVVALFLRDGDTVSGLGDQQAMWWELGMADSFVRQGKLGRALKYYKSIEKHYDTIQEDQMDFHGYSMRKSQLRAYVETLKWEDTVRNHKWYLYALLGAANCYLSMLQVPKDEEDESKQDSKDDTSKEEEKKRKMKEKKAAAKAAKALEAEMELKAAAEKEKNKGKDVKKKTAEDPDPFGEKFLKVDSPLAEAAKYAKLLKTHCPKSVETHLLAADVYMRKEKYLLVLHAMKALHSIDADNARFLPILIKFYSTISAKEASLPPLVLSVCNAEKSLLLGGLNLSEFVAAYRTKHQSSAFHRIAVAESLFHLNSINSISEINILLSDLTGAVSCESCILAHKKMIAMKIEARSFFDACGVKFPYTRYFMKADSLKVIKDEQKE